MGILELKRGNRTYTNPREILKILKSEGFYWLIDSEMADAKIEIENNTVIWNDGHYVTGNWYYGIFKNGVSFSNGKMHMGRSYLTAMEKRYKK